MDIQYNEFICVTPRVTKNREGYCSISKGSAVLVLHRENYRLLHGLTFNDMKQVMIRHMCHNKGCVNPHHLLASPFLDRKDNREDSFKPEGYRTRILSITVNDAACIIRRCRERKLDLTIRYLNEYECLRFGCSAQVLKQAIVLFRAMPDKSALATVLIKYDKLFDKVLDKY